MSETPYAPPAPWTALFDGAELFAAVIARDGRLLYGNPWLLRCTGWVVGEPVRPPAPHSAPADGHTPAHCPFAAWLSGEQPLEPLECEIVDRDGAHRRVRWHPSVVRDAEGHIAGMQLLGTDLSERRVAESRMQRASDFSRALSDMRRAAIRIDDPQHLYEATCRIIADSGHAIMAWIGLIEDNRLRPVAWSGPARHYTDGLDLRLGPSATAVMGPSARAATHGRSVVCNDFMHDPITVPWHERGERFGVKASGAFPIQRSGATVGTLNLYFGEVGAFDQALIDLVELLVCDLAFALEHLDREAARAQAVHEAQVGYERFRRLFEAIPVAVAIIKRPEGLFIDANAASTRLFGHRPEELRGHTTGELGVGLSPDDREAMLERIDRDGAVHDWETRVRHRSGEWRDVLMNIEPIEFYGRQCLLNIIVDISERRRIEEALRQRELQLSGIVESALEAIVSIDAQHRVVLFNPAAEQMFGVSREEALGGRVDRFMPAQYRHAHSAHVARFAVEGRSSRSMGGSREVMGLRANGEVFPLEASISRAGEGPQQLMTVMARDVTQLRQAERAQLARTAAEAASQAKTEFLSRISHELRTPLNAVLGFAQIMRGDTRDPLSERHRAQIELVLQAGSHLSALIEEILDVARIETGRMSLEECDFELCELLAGVMAMCEPQALQCQVALQAAYGGMAPLRVHTDPARLRQVMLNLLSNAIKYNRPGGWVRVEVQRRSGGVHISVQDNGLGMTEQQKARLFQPFNRLGREYTEVQGTGIGLVLVRQLVSLMHGELSVDSLADQGTCVHVSLPLPEPCVVVEPLTSPGEITASGVPAREGVVLYIEDNPVNVVLVEQLLARWPKVRAVVAPDGRSGIERAHALRPDIVLLDMGLPDMDGMAVLRALKADPSTRDVPVVVLSATAGALSKQAARDAGALHYWTKPIDFDRFIDGMRELLPQSVEA